MGLFRWFKRQKQSRGHGVHSPFAFHLITRVLRSSRLYYAFFDIPTTLRERGLHLELIPSLNHLSFRLVHHFKPATILEINPGRGVNTCFLLAAAPGVYCTSVSSFSILLEERASTKERFDAIFLYIDETGPPPVDMLLKLTRESSFLVIYPIETGEGKQFWKKIVNDERINVTFDMKDTGIVLPGPSLTPGNYLI